MDFGTSTGILPDMIPSSLIDHDMSLPATDRARLASVLLDSVEDTEDETVTPAWREVARERLARYRARGEQAADAAAVHAELDALAG